MASMIRTFWHSLPRLRRYPFPLFRQDRFAVMMGVNGAEGDKGALIVNPTITEQEMSDFDFIVSSSKDKVLMLEGGFCEIR